jgi:D-glycero-D-manno-heptose 1,7-bisphosphate phosphatase
LDRDGVVNRELGRFVPLWEEFEFLPGVLLAFQRLAALGIPVVVVSNQSAIGRGWVARQEVDVIHGRMVDAIRSAGGRIDEVLICPHAPGAGCACRKPQPGMLVEAARKHRFELRRALMVGDSLRDVQAARAAGAMAVLVHSGHDIPADIEASLGGGWVGLAADLAAVVECIVAESGFVEA